MVDPVFTPALITMLIVTVGNLIFDIVKTVRKSTCCGSSVVFKDDSQPNPTDLGPVE